MSKPIVIVESPAKARTIGKILGSGYTVKASMGHVRDLPKSGLGVDVENGFEAAWVPIQDRTKILKELRERVRQADQVFLATDPDREGEAIAWHLVESLIEEKERESIEVRRVVFHEITDHAIREAFQQPVTLNLARVDAYRTRRILDRLMGYQLSPLLWKKLARGLSAGRVQSVAVRLVVEREREIRSFVAEEYWRVVGRFGQGAGFDAEFLRLDGLKKALAQEKDARAVLARLDPAAAPGLARVAVEGTDGAPGGARARLQPLRDAGPFVVSGLERKAKTDRPRPPFITSTLQQAAASRYGFAAKRTMRVAQRLYEGIELPGEGALGLITYMRTDSVSVSPVARDAARELARESWGDAYVPEKPAAYRSKKGAQEAHEAIRPTDPRRRPEALRSVLAPDEWKLYDLIWRRFLASQMSPAQYEQTTLELTCGGASFEASGRITTFDGYTRVWGKDHGDDQQLPEVTQGQQLTASQVDATQHFTAPPRRYTEASLVRALEKFGIGRPSTYASILSTIVDRKYADNGEEAVQDAARQRLLAGAESPPAADAEAAAGDSNEEDEAPTEDGGLRRRSKSFHATHLGEAVTDLLLPYFDNVVNTEFTANMESELDRIAEGEVGWRKVVGDFYARFSSDLHEAEHKMLPYWQRPILLADMLCGKVPEGGGPSCPAPMAILFNRFGAYLGCSRYPACKNTLSLTGRAKAEAELTPHTCRKPNDKDEVCGRQMERKVNRWGSAFLACTGFKEGLCDGSVSVDKAGDPLWPVETSVPCPDCGSPLAVKRSRRGSFLACPRYPKCRGTLSLPTCTHASRTGKLCGKPMPDPVKGGLLACKLHPEVRLPPPPKARREEPAPAEGSAPPPPVKGRRRPRAKT